MSSLQLTGKCLLCALARTRLGTCSVLRLLYELAISLIRVSWNLPSHSFLIHLAEEQKKSLWLCLWFLYHCLLCIISGNPSANFNFTSYSLCLNSAFLILNIYGSLWEEYRWRSFQAFSWLKAADPCEFEVCFQGKFTMSDYNPGRQEFHQFPALWFQKAMAAYNRHASAPFILKSFASALKNGEQKHLQLYCLLIIQHTCNFCTLRLLYSLIFNY